MAKDTESNVNNRPLPTQEDLNAILNNWVYRQYAAADSLYKDGAAGDAMVNNIMQMLAQVYGIDMQKQINDDNLAQAELAYQRSTIAAQLQQFRDAGFSEVAARQAVAGASAGSYTPAALAAPSMDLSGLANPSELGLAQFNSQMNAAMQGINAAGQLADIGGQIIQMITSPYGGDLGAMRANNFVQTLYENMDSIPLENRSAFGIASLLRDPNCPQWLKDSQKDALRAFSSVGGRKFIDAAFTQAYQYDSQNANLDALDLRNRSARLEVQRAELLYPAETKAQQLEVQLRQIKAQTDIDLNPKRVEAWMAGLNAEINTQKVNEQDAALRLELFSNPQYRKNWLLNHAKTEEGAAILATMCAQKYGIQRDWMTNPDNAQFYALSELVDTLGFTKSEIGSVFAILTAGGTNVPTAVSKIAAGINQVFGITDPASPTPAPTLPARMQADGTQVPEYMGQTTDGTYYSSYKQKYVTVTNGIPYIDGHPIR